jgi:hypothetical protein
MIEDIRDEDEPSFLRHWGERVYDRIQFAQITAIEEHLVKYAMEGWRPCGNIHPPYDVLLICACEEGVVLMVQNQFGEWRTSTGAPHKPPRAWMPCPAPPPLNGRGHR